jgi:hypothetical protein
MGGNRRSPSFITACKYGSRIASSFVTGEEIIPRVAAWSISLMRREYTRVAEMIERRVERRAVAVVSDPATLL